MSDFVFKYYMLSNHVYYTTYGYNTRSNEIHKQKFFSYFSTNINFLQVTEILNKITDIYVAFRDHLASLSLLQSQNFNVTTIFNNPHNSLFSS
jgi:hypothetical protein